MPSVDGNLFDVKAKQKIVVVVPAYKVSTQICSVLQQIPDFVDCVFVVDDACPEKSGEIVKSNLKDPRITVITHTKNAGVGGAMITGYKEALAKNAQIIVKIDGDGQMNPSLIKNLIAPIQRGEADYVKGNRFFDSEKLISMPKNRLIGNLVLSFFSKISTGYWQIFDPNNGFTAIHGSALALLPLQKVNNRYFFESDMLFRLNLARAVVRDLPMHSKYGNEISNLNVGRVLFEFPLLHTRNFLKRICYSYFIRDFTLASLQLVLGSILVSLSGIAAIYNWINSANLNQATPTGTLVLIMMSMLSGLQFLSSFTAYDIQLSPKDPISKFAEVIE